MDRRFVLQGDWANDMRHADPQLVKAQLRRICPMSLDSFVVEEGDAVPALSDGRASLVPYGGLRWVTWWLREVGAEDAAMTPIEVPSALRPFLRRDYEIVPRDEVPGACLDMGRWFLKDATSPKSWNASALWAGDDPRPYMRDGRLYVVTERVRFESEWRAFVCRGEVVGCQRYLGDPLAFPSGGAIREMVAAYESRGSHPRSYTLDVSVRTVGGERMTEPIEVQPFASCGLYGLETRSLADMMEDGYLWYLEGSSGRGDGAAAGGKT